jgi:rRNA maturation endonuclease Nob1
VIENYIKELEEDLKIDEIYLKEYALKLPGIKHKWAGRLIRHKLEIANLKKDKEKLRIDLIKKLNETSSVKLSMPVLEKTVDNAADIKEFDSKIKVLELSIELLEKAEKTLSSTSYDVKNILEIIKLETT